MNRNRKAATDTNVNGTDDSKKIKFDWCKAGKRLLRIGELALAGVGAVGIGSLVYDKFQARKGPKPPTNIPSGPEI